MSKDDGAKVVQWDRAAGKQHQVWKLIQKDDYYFTLQVRHSGKVLVRAQRRHR